jgi:hypothetical protein
MLLRKKFFRSVWDQLPVTPDGAWAIFKTTGVGSSRYTYASDTAAAAKTFSTSADRMTAMGNSVSSVFAGGTVSSTMAKYSYAADTITDLSVQTGVSMGSGSASFSNATFGAFVPNLTGAQPTRKYTFASDTNVSSTSATVAISGGAGAGGPDAGLLAMAGTAATGSNITNVYAYADDSVVAGTTLSGSLKNGGAAGNVDAVFLVLGGSTANTSTSVYNWSDSTSVAGTAASTALLNFQSTGNSVKGVYSVRNGTTPSSSTLKCTYSSGVWANGGALSAQPAGTSNGAASNGNSGIL